MYRNYCAFCREIKKKISLNMPYLKLCTSMAVNCHIIWEKRNISVNKQMK